MGELTRRDVEEAAARLSGKVIRTPVLRSEAIDRRCGRTVHLKAENLQHIGAFKARGAQNAIAQLDSAAREHPVITYSSGNHAQAVALGAARNGLDAVIFMPEDAPAVKVESVRRLGAQIHFAGTTSIHRRDAALAFQAESGGSIIEPFDHPHTIAGQGTATLELIEQAGELDALLVPVGGGGLIAGACLALADTGVAIYSVEAAGCDSMAQSLAAGHVVPVEPGPTIADGLKPTRVGELNFAIAGPRLAGAITVSDDEIGRAVAILALEAKVVVEPSGAATLAAALRGDVPGDPRRLGLIISGGNIAPAQLTALIDRYAGEL